MNKKDYKLFESLVQYDKIKLLQALGVTLNKYYDEVEITSAYVCAKGSVPVCLIAHVDTVYKRTPVEIYHDKEKKVIWSPQGLGADDRAGIFAILKIIQQGYRPSIIFFAEEEVGGLGAKEFIKKHSQPFTKINYLIELDRQGEKDCVFYAYDNYLFEDYISSFGFETDIGLFTDICILGPAWKIPSVNLSVGYFDEHSYIETLHYEFLYETIDKVIQIIEKEIVKEHKFEYIEIDSKDPRSVYGYCNDCGYIFRKEFLIPVEKNKKVCIECHLKREKESHES